jgi:hypothetical protein
MYKGSTVLKLIEGVLMKKFALVLAVALGGSLAHASPFDDQVDAQEAANALVRCAEQAKSLLPTAYAHLGEVVGQHTKVSKDVDVKVIRFQGLVGGFFGGPPEQPVATLLVTETITQSQHSGPSSQVFTCQLMK